MDVHKALQELAFEVKDEILNRLSSNLGVNERTGTNTLIGSDLERSIDVKVDGEDKLVFVIADHYEFVVNGWYHSGRFPNTYNQALESIEDWIRRKHIFPTEGHTETSLARAIFWSIWRRGIKARPFINSGHNNNEDPSKILPFLNEYFSTWADGIFQDIIKEIDTKFD